MVEWMVNRIVNKMIKIKLITNESKAEYEYAMIILTEKIVTLSAIFILSIVWHVVFQTTLFLIFLFEIRKYSGGYHADKFSSCFFSTLGIYIIFITILYPAMLNHMQITYGILVISGIVLEILGSVNHPNMDWNKKEYEASKKLSRMIVAVEVMIVFALSMIGMSNKYIVPIAFAISLSAFLLVLGKIIKQEVSRNEEKCY